MQVLRVLIPKAVVFNLFIVSCVCDMHVDVCTCVQVCVHMCLCMYRWRPDTEKRLPQSPYTLFIATWSLIEPGTHLLARLAGQRAPEISLPVSNIPTSSAGVLDTGDQTQARTFPAEHSPQTGFFCLLVSL